MLEELQKNQKIAYRILYNALCKNTLAHAYLFTGEKGTPKKEAAFFLAQSILCSNDGFACETCTICKRVKENNYSDLIYIDGNTNGIKKKDIARIQEQFSRTAIESVGKKIYILDGMENATIDACNSLLKFLEEPQEGTYAILLCEHGDRILETIVSRCQNVPFYKNNSSTLEEELKKDYEILDAHILSHLCATKKQAVDMLESDEYQHSIYVFKEFMNAYNKNPEKAFIVLQKEIISKKRDDKEVFKTFLDILAFMIKESYTLKHECFKDYEEIMVKWKKDEILRITIETRDKIVRSVNLALLIDQFIYLWEVVNGE